MKAVLSKHLFMLGIAVQAGWYIALWISYISSSETLGRADFASFYAVGRIAQSDGFSQVYDLDLQYAMQQSILGRSMSISDILPFNHPPLLLPVQRLIAVNSYTTSFIYWELFLTSSLAIGMYFVRGLLKTQIYDHSLIPFIIMAEILFYPIFISLLKGQDTAFLLMGALIWMYGLSRRNDRTAGLGLALTIIKPQIALMMAIPFSFNRQKVFKWFLAGSSVLTIYSVLMVKFQGVVGLFQAISISVKGGSYGMSEQDMFNLTGLLIRSMPALRSDAIHMIVWIVYAAVIIGLCVLWRKSEQIRQEHIGLATIMALFASPHLHFHDLGLLILPITGVVVEMGNRGMVRGFHPASLIASISILMMTFYTSSIRFLFVYLIMGLIIVFLWFPQLLGMQSKEPEMESKG